MPLRDFHVEHQEAFGGHDGTAVHLLFFDTTLGKKWSISVIFVLLTILITFFVLFTLIDDILAFVNGGLWTNLVVIGAFSSLFCRFSD